MSRRFQFSLKWLFVLVTLGPAFFFGGMHFDRERNRRRGEAINAEIQRAAHEIEAQKARSRLGIPIDANLAE